jgi:hypothetical protein
MTIAAAQFGRRAATCMPTGRRVNRRFGRDAARCGGLAGIPARHRVGG